MCFNQWCLPLTPIKSGFNRCNLPVAGREWERNCLPASLPNTLPHMAVSENLILLPSDFYMISCFQGASLKQMQEVRKTNVDLLILQRSHGYKHPG